MENRSLNAKRNMVMGFLNRTIDIVLPFICRTVFIRLLGAEYLGLNSLFTAILQVLNMAELGFSSAIVFSMYRPMAEKRTDEVCALLSFYRSAYRGVGTVIFVAGLLLLPFLPKLINGSYPSDINIYVLYCIYLTNTALSYFAFSYKSSILTATQRQDVISNINSVLTILKSILQIVILLVWKNYYLYVLCLPLYTIFQNLLVAIITKKMYPEYECKGTIKPEIKEDITKQLKGLMVGKVSLLTRNSFDSIILSMFCGLIDVAIYSNYYYVFTSVSGILSVIILALSSGIGNSIATESTEKNFYDYKRFNFVYSTIICLCTVCMFCLYQPFMSLWAGNDLMASNYTMILFCIYFYLNQMGQVRGMYASGAGLWWEFRYLSIGEMFGNLLLNFIFGYLWGMNGIIWATIIAQTLFSLIGLTKITFNKLFKMSSWNYWKDYFFNMVITVLACFVSSKLCIFISQDSIVGLFYTGLIVLLVVTLAYFVILLVDKTKRDYFMSVVKNIIQR